MRLLPLTKFNSFDKRLKSRPNRRRCQPFEANHIKNRGYTPMQRNSQRNSGKPAGRTVHVNVNGVMIPVDTTQLTGWTAHHGVTPGGKQVNSLLSIRLGNTIFIKDGKRRISAFDADELHVAAHQLFPSTLASEQAAS